MSVIDSVRRQLTPIHPEGYIFIAAFIAATLILGWLWAPLGWIAFVATLWCAFFFRDPPRVTPLRADLVVAPADGVVSFCGVAAPPPELGLGAQPLPRVSIFMSVFDCHINRAPGRRPGDAHRLSPRRIPQRRPRQGERGQRAQRSGDRKRRRASSAWCRSPA